MYSSRIIKDPITKKRLQSTQIASPIERSANDIYVEINNGDSLSKLAYKHYGSDGHWRIIALANNISTNFPKIGTTIRIPANPTLDFINE